MRARMSSYRSVRVSHILQMSFELIGRRAPAGETPRSRYVYLRVPFHAAGWGMSVSLEFESHAAREGGHITYLRRQHGHVCFDADEREARLLRQSSHSARHLIQASEHIE